LSSQKEREVKSSRFLKELKGWGNKKRGGGCYSLVGFLAGRQKKIGFKKKSFFSLQIVKRVLTFAHPNGKIE